MKTKKPIKSMFIILILLNLLAGCSGNDEAKEDVENKGSKLITLQQFNKVEKGMSYDEVVDITGVEGEPMTEETESTTMYAWDGVAPDSFMALTFKDGKLTEKIQNGLK
ncbi:DUF3862 domain-containing protein [Bacillus sp. KH172YL63]|uniref:DUF3862 domain-containing protein n=1 Tax=Bacillus sp. KH172YL63 TaxID=2709784 RepID=UPI0013E41F7C|nr:DUF3862 domain-containing protein [Bacillus sp. KH172YL63]BCB02411.1 hypothetical protein KH172YL63_05440 [Bacillus sp. KH172YL63]